MSNNRLTGRQALFVEEYLQDFNATRAAERAGYAGDENALAVQGHRLLSYVKIKNLIHLRLQEAAMTADEVLARLAAIARSDHSKYLTKEGSVDFGRLIADEQGFLIKSIKDTKDGKYIEFYNAQRALETFAKHHGLLVERHALVDWRKEAQEQGFDPTAALERLVQDTVETVTASSGEPDGGSVAGSEAASEDET